MNSISRRIQSTILSSIIVVTVCAGVLLIISHLNTISNQIIIETMTMEHGLIGLTDDLIQTYNASTKDPDNATISTSYTGIRTKIISTLEALKQRTNNEESKILLIGVNNTILSVISECDTGLKEIASGNYQFLSEHYEQSHKLNEFVKQNVTNLLNEELEFLVKTQQKQRQSYYLLFILASIIFTFVIATVIYFSQQFSKQLVKPLVSLSLIAKDIVTGDLQAMNKKSLPITDDEIGSLTQSVQVMVAKLTGLLSQQQVANEHIQRAKDELTKKNEELVRVNELMIDRELKMTELKKEMIELKNKLSAKV